MKLTDLRKIAEAGTPDSIPSPSYNPDDDEYIDEAFLRHKIAFPPKTVLALLDIIEKQREAMSNVEAGWVSRGKAVESNATNRIDRQTLKQALTETNKMLEEIK